MKSCGRYSFVCDEAGSILPVFTLVLFVVLGMGALAIDSTRGFAARDQLQASADAAALAGAAVVFNPSLATANAVNYGNLNAPGGVSSVMTNSDIVLGSWDPNTKTFTAGGASPNAVQATAQMTQSSSGGLQTQFASIFGVNNMDVRAQAIATGDNGAQWDIVIVQDVTSSFSAELGDAKTADQTLL